MTAVLDRLGIRGEIRALVAFFAASLLVGTYVDYLSVRQVLTSEKELKTRHLVESAFSVLGYFHELQIKGELSEAAARGAAVNAIKSMRYGK